MKFRKYPSLARAAEALTKQGFSGRFALEKDGLILDESAQYDPEDVAIVAYYRFFPQDKDRNRVSIVFALEAVDGKKGLLVSSYNAYGKVNLLEFMDRVKIKSSTESVM